MPVMGKGIFLYMTESAGDCIIPGEFPRRKLLPRATPFTVIGFPKHQMVILGNPSGIFQVDKPILIQPEKPFILIFL